MLLLSDASPDATVRGTSRTRTPRRRSSSPNSLQRRTRTLPKECPTPPEDRPGRCPARSSAGDRGRRTPRPLLPHHARRLRRGEARGGAASQRGKARRRCVPVRQGEAALRPGEARRGEAAPRRCVPRGVQAGLQPPQGTDSRQHLPPTVSCRRAAAAVCGDQASQPIVNTRCHCPRAAVDSQSTSPALTNAALDSPCRSQSSRPPSHRPSRKNDAIRARRKGGGEHVASTTTSLLLASRDEGRGDQYCWRCAAPSHLGATQYPHRLLEELPARTLKIQAFRGWLMIQEQEGT